MRDIGIAAGDGEATVDHGTIREWVEERGGEPAVASTGGGAGALRIRFPDADDGGEPEPIDWSDFFRRFDEADLAFVYRGGDAAGDDRFYRFVDRMTIAGR